MYVLCMYECIYVSTLFKEGDTKQWTDKLAAPIMQQLTITIKNIHRIICKLQYYYKYSSKDTHNKNYNKEN